MRTKRSRFNIRGPDTKYFESVMNTLCDAGLYKVAISYAKASITDAALKPKNLMPAFLKTLERAFDDDYDPQEIYNHTTSLDNFGDTIDMYKLVKLQAGCLIELSKNSDAPEESLKNCENALEKTREFLLVNEKNPMATALYIWTLSFAAEEGFRDLVQSEQELCKENHIYDPRLNITFDGFLLPPTNKGLYL